ncbi:MAG: hypothetical protein K0S10_2216 [Rubrobacteraceae bacterium]|nr:hypothetical protein [Rubrobacteraceae bacterium]
MGGDFAEAVLVETRIRIRWESVTEERLYIVYRLT